MDSRTREINADTERLHQRLRNIAQSVINDEDDFYTGDESGRISPRRLSPLRGGDRFDSPDRNFSRYVILLTDNFSREKTASADYSNLLVRTFIFLVLNQKYASNMQ